MLERLDDMTNQEAPLGDASFQTQVLVSLAEIKGSITLIAERGARADERLEEHKNDIVDLRKRHDDDVSELRSANQDIRSSQARLLGGAIALSVVVPAAVSIIVQLITN